MLTVLPLCIVVVALLRWWIATLGTGVIPLYVFIWSRIDNFAAGAFIAIAIRTPSVRPILERRSLAGLWIAAAGVIGFGYGPLGLHWRKWDPLQIGVVYGFIALFFAMLISVLLASKERPTRLQRAFSSKALGRIGLYSYAIYLFHLPIETLARGWGLHPSVQAPIFGSIIPVALLYIGGDALAAFGAAWLSWHGDEKFFMNLRGRFLYPGES